MKAIRRTRQDLNPQPLFRRQMLYPLSYGCEQPLYPLSYGCRTQIIASLSTPFSLLEAPEPY